MMTRTTMGAGILLKKPPNMGRPKMMIKLRKPISAISGVAFAIKIGMCV